MASLTSAIPRRGLSFCLSVHSSRRQLQLSTIGSCVSARSHASRSNTKNAPTHFVSGPELLSLPDSNINTRNLSTNDKDHRHKILSNALTHVHAEGWSDDAVASGTLDAGFPPSYIGRASSSTSIFGSADLVAFFMDQCNNELKKELERLKSEESESGEDIATRMHRALQIRLTSVVPFVSSKRWHKGMAIGALPQNAYRTATQLDEMAQIVLEYVLNNSQAAGAAQRAAVVTAYAAAELHLVSEGMNQQGVSGSSISYSGERYNLTWNFLRQRCDEAAGLLTDGNSGLPIPGVPLNPTHVTAATAVASSLVGAAFSLASPAAAAVAGQALPKVMETLSPLTNYVASQNSAGMKDGTKPSDYEVENLPPFDSNEVIFSESDAKTA